MTTPVPSLPREGHDAEAPQEASLVAPKTESAATVAKPAPAKSAKPVAKVAKPVVKAAPSPVLQPLASGISGAEAARALRKARARRLLLALALWVGLPVLLAVVYYGFLAQPEFESEASFAVRGSDATARAAMLREYIGSPEMRAALDKTDGFFDHFEAAKDPLVRLSKSAGSEARAASYRAHVKTEYDAQTGIFILRVRAFSGKAAAAFARTIAKESRRLFKRIDDEAATRRLAQAGKDLSEARARLLAMELGDSTEPVPGEASPAVNARVKQVTQQLAEREVEAALTALSQVRTSVQAHEAPLVTISKPSTPTEAAYPRRLYGVTTVLFVSLALFGIGALLISAVREHAQF